MWCLTLVRRCPITAYRTGFWVYTALVSNTIFSIYKYHYEYLISLWLLALLRLYVHYYSLGTTDLGFLISGNLSSVIPHLPGCFCPWTFLVHVTIGRLYAKFVFSTRLFYGGVWGIATDSSGGVWCRWLTTCPLYFGPHFGNLVLNDNWFVSFT